MRKTQQIAAIVILILAGLTAYGFWETRQSLPPVATVGAKKDGQAAESLVDQRALKDAQQLAQLAASQDEKNLAQEALRLADYDVDLAFDDAIREARIHPPALSPEAKEAKARQQEAEKVLEAEQGRAKQLAEDLVKATGEKQEAIQSDLVQAEADMELAQDEVDDAKHDMQIAGGDPVDRVLAMKKEHEETAHNAPTASSVGQETADRVGLVHRTVQWQNLHQKQVQLWRAKSSLETAAAALTAAHNALDSQIEAEKASTPELAHHAKKSKPAAPGAYAAAADKGRTESADLLKKTEALSGKQKVLAAYDKRIETKRELAGVYAQWIDLVAAHQRAVVHRGLWGIAIILGIALVSLFFTSWMDSLVARLPMDRRQIESLRTVTRVTLQILALSLILLVIFGPPGQLGTFLGLAGAGLTVALKDFIVGFIGWFVLMGKNGMRLGDWVEINGVTGEVVQIGPFHTVLMETGNWTDSGHPTGRRVTFTNSFAIEGHYFNFSTSGQWLWDELAVVLPAGRDPYPLIDAIHKKVAEATRESTQQAEQEWRSASTSRELSGISVEPAISVKPVIGGVEVAVRYITRASERYALRAKLNQAAVELLGGKPEPVAS
jgi:small-conductance mechanosensitive channel